MKGRVLILGVMVMAAVAGLTVWRQTNRVHFVQTLCGAGLPNLSRPPEVDAEALGCAVLGPRRRVIGFVSSSFENSSLTIGDKVVRGTNGFENESAWLTGTEGLERRGGDALERELEVPRPGLCGGRLAKVTLEGWMTVSRGGFGHMNLAEREFYADRVVAVAAPTSEELAPFAFGTAPDSPPEMMAFCREAEQAGEAIIGLDSGVERLNP